MDGPAAQGVDCGWFNRPQSDTATSSNPFLSANSTIVGLAAVK